MEPAHLLQISVTDVRIDDAMADSCVAKRQDYRHVQNNGKGGIYAQQHKLYTLKHLQTSTMHLPAAAPNEIRPKLVSTLAAI